MQLVLIIKQKLYFYDKTNIRINQNLKWIMNSKLSQLKAKQTKKDNWYKNRVSKFLKSSLRLNQLKTVYPFDGLIIGDDGFRDILCQRTNHLSRNLTDSTRVS